MTQRNKGVVQTGGKRRRSLSSFSLEPSTIEKLDVYVKTGAVVINKSRFVEMAILKAIDEYEIGLIPRDKKS